MADERPARELEKIMVRLPDGMRDRLAVIAKANKRSVNAEVVAALEGYLDLVEHGQQVAHELANDLPVPEKVRGTWYVHSDAEGRVTRRTLLSEWETIEAELGIHTDDVRIINVTREDAATDPVKARMAADVQRSREIAEGKSDDA